MRLPFAPPLAPMLSRAADALPGGDGWQFEPKWDGFRTLVFRDGAEILLQSRDEKPMNRYFPELVAPLAVTLPERCVVDGEIVIVGEGGLDFEALLLRIHPAASRGKLLAAQSPASFVAWDLLALGDEDLRDVPLAAPRERPGAGAGGGGAPAAPSPPPPRPAPPGRRGPAPPGGAGGGEGEGSGAAARRGAGPVESGQGPGLGAAAARAGVRGRLRPHAGDALPARRAVPALASRQAAAGLPLRSAGGHARLRARA